MKEKKRVWFLRQQHGSARSTAEMTSDVLHDDKPFESAADALSCLTDAHPGIYNLGMVDYWSVVETCDGKIVWETYIPRDEHLRMSCLRGARRAKTIAKLVEKIAKQKRHFG